MLGRGISDDDLKDLRELVSEAYGALHVLQMEALKDRDYYWEPGNAGFVTREGLLAAVTTVEKRFFPERYAK